MWEYKAKVLRVIDGDTIEVLIDLGFRISVQHHIRVVGINTPELNSPVPETRILANRAKQRVVDLLADTSVKLQTFKPYPSDKYGRWLANVINSEGLSISKILLDEGLAVPY